MSSLERLRKYLPELYNHYRVTFPRFTQRPQQYVLVSSRVAPYLVAVWGRYPAATNVPSVTLRSVDGKTSWAAYEDHPFVYNGRFIDEITDFDLTPKLLQREWLRKAMLRSLLAPVLSSNLIGYVLQAY